MQDKLDEDDIESIRLPRNWSQSVRNAALNVLGILRIAMLDGRKLLMEHGRAPEGVFAFGQDRQWLSTRGAVKRRAVMTVDFFPHLAVGG